MLQSTKGLKDVSEAYISVSQEAIRKERRHKRVSITDNRHIFGAGREVGCKEACRGNKLQIDQSSLNRSLSWDLPIKCLKVNQLSHHLPMCQLSYEQVQPRFWTDALKTVKELTGVCLQPVSADHNCTGKRQWTGEVRQRSSVTPLVDFLNPEFTGSSTTPWSPLKAQ